MDAAKRLRTMALTCEAPTSAWQGVLAGLNKFEAFLAATRAREGSDEVLATIAPLTAATALAKRLIRCERVCPYDSSARCRDAHDTRSVTVLEYLVLSVCCGVLKTLWFRFFAAQWITMSLVPR